jgi:penicillin amidase
MLIWIVPAAVLSLLILVVAIALVIAIRRPFPTTDGTISLSGIENSIDIVRDTDGVPHIYAETATDMYFAQGYVHAQDRFWQMEFWRRLGAGRLSEYFGESTLGVDRFMRTMGFTHIAREEYAELPANHRRAIDAYVAGVNAYIGARRPKELGLEFALLGLQGVEVEIEPWKPVNTMTWLKIMAYDLGGNLQDELNRLDLLRLVGAEKAADFYPDYAETNPPYITSAMELRGSLGSIMSEGSARTTATEVPDSRESSSTSEPGFAAGPSIFGEMTVPRAFIGGVLPEQSLAFGKGGGVGSNSWVVSGERTATGKPLLAADLHLGIQMPSIWYEVVLHAEEDDLREFRDDDARRENRAFSAGGFSFAGVPGVVLGHNSRIAWGLTNVNPDVQDLYLEQVNPEDPNQYRVGDEWRAMQRRVEVIHVHGRSEPVRQIVRSTRNGPIVSDAEGPQAERSGFGLDAPSSPPESVGLSELSMKWTAFEPNRTFQSLFQINRAETFEDFRRAARRFDIPAQNLVYADVDGNIGYQTPGLIPIRGAGDGSYPAPGWDDRYQWEGFIPFEELPWVLNPEKGYIATANNPIAPPEYPHLITRDFNYGQRAERIVEMIESAEDPMTHALMADIQGDSRNLPAETIVPHLTRVTAETVDGPEGQVSGAAIERLQLILSEWDRDMAVDSPGAAAYALAFQGLLRELLRDEIPESHWSASRLLGNTSRVHAFLVNILPESENPWWDDVTTLERVEERDEIILRALAWAVYRGRDLLGDSMDRWRWGELHTVTFRNQTFGDSGIRAIEALFNRGPLPAPSGLDQVYSLDYDLSDPFEATHHTSMRQVIDLSNLDASVLMHSTGQSGHPYHRHYDNFIERWLRVEFHPRHWRRDEVNAAARDVLVLTPDSSP